MGLAQALRRPGLLRGISANVVALGFVSLFNDVSSDLLVQVIPLYLANVLAASPAIIGVIEGVVESASSILRLLSGALSDRLGRRSVLVSSGYATSVAFRTLYLAASSWPIVLLARFGDRVGKGIRTAPRDALIADSTPEDARGRAFGLHRAMDTGGAVIGVALAAFVVALMQGDALRLGEDTFRALVILALVPGVIAVIIAVVAVRDVASLARAGRAAAAPRVPLSAYPRSFWFFIAAATLFTLGNSSDAFLALRSQQLGVTVRDLLLVVIAFNVTNTVIALPFGALSDRIGRRRVILAAWAVYAIAYAGFAVATSASVVPFLWILYGGYYGIIEAAGRALVADLAPVAARATAFGIYNMAVGLALLPASIVAGVLWDRLGAPSTFWFGAACAAAALVLLAGLVRTPGRPPGVDPASA
jgi:MFS family permease